jgi:hypothetical protein
MGIPWSHRRVGLGIAEKRILRDPGTRQVHTLASPIEAIGTALNHHAKVGFREDTAHV